MNSAGTPGKERAFDMSDSQRNSATLRGVGVGRAAAYDVGLRAHMISVYNYMAAGVALTGVIAWVTFSLVAETSAGGLTLTPLGQTLFQGPIFYVILFAPLILVFALSFGVARMSVTTARGLFFLYAGLLGLSLASIFLVYTEASITRVFFISAASFGALSLWGYTTQRDLSGMGSFLIMGLFGLIIASVVNLFLRSSGLDWALSVMGVIVFAGLTAWDTQKIKEMYDPTDDNSVGGRKAIMGALSLYLDFINLFLSLLRLVGDRR